DADRGALLDERATGQVPAVAGGTEAALGFAGHRGADEDPHDAAGIDLVGDAFANLLAAVADDLAGRLIDDGHCGVAADDAAAQRFDGFAVFLAFNPEPAGGATVLFEDDDVLSHVDEAAGEVPGVRRAQCGVGETFAGAMGGDEVLEDREPFAEGATDREFDDLAVRVGHETAHTGHLADLGDVT